jgi:hypothetical protein
MGLTTATNCGSTGHWKTFIDRYKSIHLWPVDPQFVATGGKKLLSVIGIVK